MKKRRREEHIAYTYLKMNFLLLLKSHSHVLNRIGMTLFLRLLWNMKQRVQHKVKSSCAKKKKHWFSQVRALDIFLLRAISEVRLDSWSNLFTCSIASKTFKWSCSLISNKDLLYYLSLYLFFGRVGKLIDSYVCRASNERGKMEISFEWRRKLIKTFDCIDFFLSDQFHQQQPWGNQKTTQN